METEVYKGVSSVDSSSSKMCAEEVEAQFVRFESPGSEGDMSCWLVFGLKSIPGVSSLASSEQ